MTFTALKMRRFMPAQSINSLPGNSYRIDSIDLLRGLVMIIMALDHTRDFFHAQALTADPLNLATTTPLLFFTRFITHFCAPVFVFLAGSSAFFQSLRKSKKDLSQFLIKRGFWLVLVELAIVTLGITFNPFYNIFILQTIWAIGISMIVLGLAIHLPFSVVLATGLLLVFGHNTLDLYERTHAGPFSPGYLLLHRPGFFPLDQSHFVMAQYPIIPWIGLMMLGYCFGKVFQLYQGVERKKLITYIGVILLLMFVILRAINEYGDPQPWSEQKNLTFSILSFLNVQKYPPSLLYMAITIGPALLFLAFAGDTKSRLGRIITVYGRVPFFYYILHFYVLHALSAIFFLMRGHTFTEGITPPPNLPFLFAAPGEGYSLLIVYVIWIAVVAALYPLCKWFSDYKRTHKQWWLSYL